MSSIDYELIRQVGKGAFGQVYLAAHRKTKQEYIIKKVEIRNKSEKERDVINREVKMLQSLNHLNIVAYKDAFLDPEGYLNLVMAYCEQGDLSETIELNKGRKFAEKQVVDWAAQIALAVLYLHDRRILHRDLKTPNIFLTNGKVRLGDFGIAKVLDQTADLAQTNIGTPYYMSPEQFKSKPYSYKSDIWSFGLILYEMCNHKRAFEGRTIQGLCVAVIRGIYAPVSDFYSEPLRTLIKKMLSQNPKERPTVRQILAKPVIRRRLETYFQQIWEERTTIDPIIVHSMMEQAKQLQIEVDMGTMDRQMSVEPTFRRQSVTTQPTEQLNIGANKKPQSVHPESKKAIAQVGSDASHGLQKNTDKSSSSSTALHSQQSSQHISQQSSQSTPQQPLSNLPYQPPSKAQQRRHRRQQIQQQLRKNSQQREKMVQQIGAIEANMNKLSNHNKNSDSHRNNDSKSNGVKNNDSSDNNKNGHQNSNDNKKPQVKAQKGRQKSPPQIGKQKQQQFRLQEQYDMDYDEEDDYSEEQQFEDVNFDDDDDEEVQPERDRDDSNQQGTGKPNEKASHQVRNNIKTPEESERYKSPEELERLKQSLKFNTQTAALLLNQLETVKNSNNNNNTNTKTDNNKNSNPNYNNIQNNNNNNNRKPSDLTQKSQLDFEISESQEQLGRGMKWIRVRERAIDIEKSIRVKIGKQQTARLLAMASTIHNSHSILTRDVISKEIDMINPTNSSIMHTSNSSTTRKEKAGLLYLAHQATVLRRVLEKGQLSSKNGQPILNQ